MKIRCFLLESELVDFATGTLEDRRSRAVERHIAGCVHCSESVLALREIPAELARRGRPEPGEEFWARQRDRIMQVIEAGPPVPARRPIAVRKPSAAWRMVPAVAAAAVAVFALVEWLPSSTAKKQSGESVTLNAERPAVESVATSADDSVTALVDEPWPTVPEDVASADDTTLAESLARELDAANDGGLI
jgi:anti-sigma factor RsiW